MPLKCALEVTINVTGNGTIRYVVYEFLLSSIITMTIVKMAISSSRFLNKARYWSKTPIFHPLPFNLHDHLESLLISFQNFNTNCPSEYLSYYSW